jgi:hypothetical protein
MESSPPKNRLYARIPARRVTKSTVEAQPSQHVDEMAQDPHPPSPIAFMVEETLLDSTRTPSETDGGFAEYFNDELDSTILAHEDEREQVTNTSILLDSQQVRSIDTYVILDVYVI